MAKQVRTSFETGFLPEKITINKGNLRPQTGSDLYGWALASYGDSSNSYDTQAELEVDLGNDKNEIFVYFEFCGVGAVSGNSLPTDNKPILPSIIFEFGNFKLAIENNGTKDELVVYDGTTEKDRSDFVLNNAIKDKWYKCNLKIIGNNSTSSAKSFIRIEDMDLFNPIFEKLYDFSFDITSNTIMLKGNRGSRFSGIDNVGVNDLSGSSDNNLVGQIIGEILPVHDEGDKNEWETKGFAEIYRSVGYSNNVVPYGAVYVPYNDTMYMPCLGSSTDDLEAFDESYIYSLDYRLGNFNLIYDFQTDPNPSINVDDTFPQVFGYIPFYNYLVIGFVSHATGTDSNFALFDLTDNSIKNYPGGNYNIFSFLEDSYINNSYNLTKGLVTKTKTARNLETSSTLVPTTENNSFVLLTGMQADNDKRWVILNPVDTSIAPEFDSVSSTGTAITVYFNPVNRSLYVYERQGSVTFQIVKISPGLNKNVNKILPAIVSSSDNTLRYMVYAKHTNSYIVTSRGDRGGRRNARDTVKIGIVVQITDNGARVLNGFQIDVINNINFQPLLGFYNELAGKLVLLNPRNNLSIMYFVNERDILTDSLGDTSDQTASTFTSMDYNDYGVSYLNTMAVIPTTNEIIYNSHDSVDFSNIIRFIREKDEARNTINPNDAYSMTSKNSGEVLKYDQKYLDGAQLNETEAVNTQLTFLGGSSNLEMGYEYDGDPNVENLNPVKTLEGLNTRTTHNVEQMNNPEGTPWTKNNLNNLQLYFKSVPKS